MSIDHEDLGRCIGCNAKLEVGQVLTVWVDEVGHADCDRPFDLTHEHPAGADWPPPSVVLGSPARYYALAAVVEAIGSSRG